MPKIKATVVGWLDKGDLQAGQPSTVVCSHCGHVMQFCVNPPRKCGQCHLELKVLERRK